MGQNRHDAMMADGRQFDGIWACASLLHVPRAEMEAVFARRALDLVLGVDRRRVITPRPAHHLGRPAAKVNEAPKAPEN
jgi:hypothetical protein